MLHRPCKNIIVVAGAGISTASGIPDFRTPGTGLYANMKKYNIPYPEAIFDIDFFTCDPQPFYSLAKDLYPGSYQPNYIHYFVRMLHEKGMLLRMYTQNIDGLERMCGIPEDKLVEAHGTFSSASCHLCYAKFPAKEAKKSILSNKIPKCKICQGTVKPDVVFFGEDLPQKFCLYSKDFPKADLLIVMGTSLQITCNDFMDHFNSKVNGIRKQIELETNTNTIADACSPSQSLPTLDSFNAVNHQELVSLINKIKTTTCTLEIKTWMTSNFLMFNSDKTEVTLDYCNAILSGSTNRPISALQLVQNAAARILTKYLKDLHIEYTPSQPLRSQEAGYLVVPKIHKKTAGGRAFSYRAPKLWNDLPANFLALKSRLKTHLFSLCFSST
ncbi:SIR3 deacetylase, partial [Amia calva]|nr:SIR3 deacetylase [Amia calva]